MSAVVPTRPRRSCLYMPGSNTRAMDKARNLPADVVILDLEDAVAPDAKAQARDQVIAAVQSGGYGHREVWIRVNPLSSEWGEEDFRAAIAAKPDGILLPKVNDAGDIHNANERLQHEQPGGACTLWAMVESPLAVINLANIAETTRSTRLAGFVVGTNDLAKDLRLGSAADRTALLSTLSATVIAARAYGLDAIDGVFNDIDDPEGLLGECAEGRRLGFDGKTLIHPSQIDVTNRVFSPAPDAIVQAQAICDAFADPDNAGKGVIKVDGKMTERLHLAEAERTLAFARAIADREVS